MEASGSKNPTWLFVGEAPGENEDKAGEPFVGKAGRVLRGIIVELEFPHDEIAITNSVRCWPGPKNRTPTPEEIRTCKPYLMEDIERLNPKVVVMLGAVALKAAANKTGITKLRGTAWEENGRYYIATFHPSATFYDQNKLKDIIEDLEKAKNLPEAGIPKPDAVNWVILDDFDSVRAFFDYVKDEPDLFHDYETSTNIAWTEGARILMAGYSWAEGQAVSIPIFHKDSPFTQEEKEAIIQMIDDLHKYRNERELPMSGYNLVFDEMFGKIAHNITLPILGDDPYLGSHLLNEELSKPSLSQLAWTFLPIGGYDNELNDMKEKNPDLYDLDRGGSYDNFPIPILGYYNCGDCDASLRLAKIFRKKMEKQGLLDLYHDVVVPSTYPIMEYVSNGIRIDGEFLNTLITQYTARMNSIIMDCRQLPDVQKWEQSEVKRLKSLRAKELKEKYDKWNKEENERLQKGLKPRQKREYKRKPIVVAYDPSKDAHTRGVVFDIAKITPIKKTASKTHYSIDREVREALENSHPLIPLVDEYASLKKFYSSYVQRLSKAESTGWIFHPKFDMTGTVSGRLVGDLQQLPKTKKNSDIKKLFVSRFGSAGLLMNTDVKSAEVRMLGIVSKDPNLREDFFKFLDPHSMAACRVHGYDYDDFIQRIIDKEPGAVDIRDKMKAVLFGLIYGKVAESFAKDFGWSLAKAEQFVNKYFGKYEKVREMISYYHLFASSHGYVCNMQGRRRRLPKALKSIHVPSFERDHALRQAVNFVIQSSMHDLVLYSIVQVDQMFKHYGLESKLCGEVHDSLIIDCYKTEVDFILEILQTVFESLPVRYDWIDIPIEIEAAVGPNLADMENIF